jgi:hypothetical protein
MCQLPDVFSPEAFAEGRSDYPIDVRCVPTSLTAAKNVIRIRLASIEIPLVEYTFSAVKGNLNFYVNSLMFKNEWYIIKINPWVFEFRALEY